MPVMNVRRPARERVAQGPSTLLAFSAYALAFGFAAAVVLGLVP